MKALEWTLRIALFGEFLGHGIFAYRAVPHFQELMAGSLGVSTETAANILPIIGIIDFGIAILALIYPMRAVLIYATLWGLLTGLSRPISGNEIWDFVERWPNWGVPLGLLLVRGWPKQLRDWFR